MPENFKMYKAWSLLPRNSQVRNSPPNPSLHVHSRRFLSIFQVGRSSKVASKRARLGWAKFGEKWGGGEHEKEEKGEGVGRKEITSPPPPALCLLALVCSFFPFACFRKWMQAMQAMQASPIPFLALLDLPQSILLAPSKNLTLTLLLIIYDNNVHCIFSTFTLISIHFSPLKELIVLLSLTFVTRHNQIPVYPLPGGVYGKRESSAT